MASCPTTTSSPAAGRLPISFATSRLAQAGRASDNNGSRRRLLQPRTRAADARRMSGPNTDRTETRKIVRRGERTIDVRLITYPGGKRTR
jgi:hypothetical protein